MDSDEGHEESMVESASATGGVRPKHTAGVSSQYDGEMKSYKSVLSRLVTSVKALPVFGSSEKQCPSPSTATTTIELP
jgi:hypothetical protein